MTPPVTVPAPVTQTPVEAPKPEPATPTIAIEVPGQVQDSQAQDFTIETDLYRVEFSNQGATVRSWILKKYKDGKGKPLDLVNTRALPKVPAPFAVAFRNQAPPNDPNKGLFRVERSGDLGVTFEYSDGRTATKKTFQFMPKSYLVEITSQVIDNGVLLPHELTWRGGFGDQTIVNPASVEDVAYYDESNSKLVQNALKSADKGPVTSSGQYSFAGIEDSYFAALALPAESSAGLAVTTYSDLVPGPAGTDEKRIGTGVGGSGLNSFNLFVGPKDSQILGCGKPQAGQVDRLGEIFRVHRQAAVLCLDLDRETRDRRKFRLGHYRGHRRHQYGALPAALHEHEVVQEDAGPAAADPGDQRQVQRHADARSPQAGTAGGDDGAVQEARRQSGGRMRPDGYPAPVSDTAFTRY